MKNIRRLACVAFVAAILPATANAQGSYLFVWAGGPSGNESLVTIDAKPASPTYGRVLASVSTGVVGSPHHTELQLGSGGHLLANDFHAGHTYLFDVSDPLHPRVMTSFGDVAGFSHPHSFLRLANGHVLSTFQYRPEAAEAVPQANMHDHMQMSGEHVTGGLVEMNELGTPFAFGDAADTTITDRRLYPYAVLPIPSINRAVSTTTDMDHADTISTSQWVQIWRLSDLKLMRSIELPPGPRGNENHLTGEVRLLPDGHSAYVHTFNCGLYLLRDIDHDRPKASLVASFEGEGCGVPILTGHYWLQTVPDSHALVALDITDAEHPREISRVTLPADEAPHWVSIDATGRRVVLNSGGRGSRLFIIDFDPATGGLSLDRRFRDPGDDSAGITLTGANWPGFTGKVRPHGSVFSR